MIRRTCLLITAVAGLMFVSQAAGRSSTAGSAPPACQHAQRTLESAARQASPSIYDDFIEDSGNAPDFCGEDLVTNDNQTITMGIHVHNRDGFAPGDGYAVLLDTDRNAGTGQAGTGAEYEVTLGPAGAQLNRWNGTGFEQASATPARIDWIEGYGPAFQLARSEIGDPTGFDFVLVSTKGTDSDRAPDSGSWTYMLGNLTLRVRSLSVGSARAGQAFTARLLVMRSDFDIPLDEGSINCSAKLAGRRIQGRGVFAHDRAACTWRLPRGATGKRLVGSTAVVFEGVHASRSFSVRVR
jgi:hypothetical protein